MLGAHLGLQPRSGRDLPADASGKGELQYSRCHQATICMRGNGAFVALVILHALVRTAAWSAAKPVATRGSNHCSLSPDCSPSAAAVSTPISYSRQPLWGWVQLLVHHCCFCMPSRCVTPRQTHATAKFMSAGRSDTVGKVRASVSRRGLQTARL